MVRAIGVLVSLRLWWGDFGWETNRGEMSLQVSDNLKLRLGLLMLTEVILLASLLWALFHLALSPSVLVGLVWPIPGTTIVAPTGGPLINTALLVGRGVTITWGHHLLLTGDKAERAIAIIVTVGLGAALLVNQRIELREVALRLRDRAYGRVLLVLTGLHGAHVLLGLIMIRRGINQLVCCSLTSRALTRIELFIWYWHLVDCVWLGVYCVVYWWRK